MLDVSHGCFSGSYSSFGWFREEVAKAAGWPPLRLMEGYFDLDDVYERLTLAEMRRIVEASKDAPIPWTPYQDDPLYVLLGHSDCDGKIAAADCAAIADRLEAIRPKLVIASGISKRLVQIADRFIAGLRCASADVEDVVFS
jgi:hypothetical protein